LIVIGYFSIKNQLGLNF